MYSYDLVLGYHFQRILLWPWHFRWPGEQQLSHYCLLMELIGKIFTHILIPPFFSINCRGWMIMALLKVLYFLCSFFLDMSSFILVWNFAHLQKNVRTLWIGSLQLPMNLLLLYSSLFLQLRVVYSLWAFWIKNLMR